MILSQQTFLLRSFPSLNRLHVSLPPSPHLFQQFFLLRGKGQAFPERCLIIVRERQSWRPQLAACAFRVYQAEASIPAENTAVENFSLPGGIAFFVVKPEMRTRCITAGFPARLIQPFISNLLRRISAKFIALVDDAFDLVFGE